MISLLLSAKQQGAREVMADSLRSGQPLGVHREIVVSDSEVAQFPRAPFEQFFQAKKRSNEHRQLSAICDQPGNDALSVVLVMYLLPLASGLSLDVQRIVRGSLAMASWLVIVGRQSRTRLRQGRVVL